MFLNFKLSDSSKHNLLFNLINPNYNEAGNYEIGYGICDVYDEYALCYDYEKQEFCRFYYQKDDEKNTCSLIGEPEKCFIVDVTEGEYAALNLLKNANGGNFEKVDEVYTTANDKIESLTIELAEKNSEFDTKVVELETANATLVMKDEALAEKETAFTALQETLDATTATIAEKENQIETLNASLSTLTEYKDTIETSAKQAIIDKFAELIDEDVLKTISAELSNYTVLTLEKELAYQAVQKNPSVFSKENSFPEGYIPTGGSDNLSGATKILMKHKKK